MSSSGGAEPEGAGADAVEMVPMPETEPDPARPPSLAELPSLEAAHLLYETVVAEDLARFRAALERCAHQQAVLDHCHGDGYTCLQLACDRKLSEFVRRLLEAGADPAVASAASGRTALHCAAARDHRILRQLLQHAPHLNVNVVDGLGFTPLHHAVQNGNPEAMRLLLGAGADLAVRDDLDQPLLHALPVDVLQDHLDSCVTTNGRYASDLDYQIKFDYALMSPRRPAERELFEMEVAWNVSTSREHRHLLRHPLFTSFLDLKWRQARGFFMFDLAAYAVLVVLMTTYLFLLVEIDVEWRERDTGFLVCHYLAVVYIVVLIVLKVAQICSAPVRYTLWAKNDLVKVPLLIMAAVLLFHDMTRDQVLQMASLVMLFTWLGFFSAFSRMPFFSVYGKMFATVLSRFLKFLLCYLLLIMGFSLSMYIMFKEDNPRASPGGAMLRTLVMTIDKMDLSTLPGRIEPPAGQLAFVAFLFIITVVLTNLLNGLAVADTVAIRNEAHTFCLVSRVQLLTYTESIMLDRCFRFLGTPLHSLSGCAKRFDPGDWCLCLPSRRSCCLCCTGRWLCCLRAWYMRQVLLFAAVVPDRHVSVLPNRPGRPLVPAAPCRRTFSKQVLEDARRLLRRRGERLRGELHQDLSRQLSQLEQRLSQQRPEYGL